MELVPQEAALSPSTCGNFGRQFFGLWTFAVNPGATYTVVEDFDDPRFAMQVDCMGSVTPQSLYYGDDYPGVQQFSGPVFTAFGLVTVCDVVNASYPVCVAKVFQTDEYRHTGGLLGVGPDSYDLALTGMGSTWTPSPFMPMYTITDGADIVDDDERPRYSHPRCRTSPFEAPSSPIWVPWVTGATFEFSESVRADAHPNAALLGPVRLECTASYYYDEEQLSSTIVVPAYGAGPKMMHDAPIVAAANLGFVDGPFIEGPYGPYGPYGSNTGACLAVNGTVIVCVTKEIGANLRGYGVEASDYEFSLVDAGGNVVAGPARAMDYDYDKLVVDGEEAAELCRGRGRGTATLVVPAGSGDVTLVEAVASDVPADRKEAAEAAGPVDADPCYSRSDRNFLRGLANLSPETASAEAPSGAVNGMTFSTDAPITVRCELRNEVIVICVSKLLRDENGALVSSLLGLSPSAFEMTVSSPATGYSDSGTPEIGGCQPQYDDREDVVPTSGWKTELLIPATEDVVYVVGENSPHGRIQPADGYPYCVRDGLARQSLSIDASDDTPTPSGMIFVSDDDEFGSRWNCVIVNEIQPISLSLHSLILPGDPNAPQSDFVLRIVEVGNPANVIVVGADPGTGLLEQDVPPGTYQVEVVDAATGYLIDRIDIVVDEASVSSAGLVVASASALPTTTTEQFTITENTVSVSVTVVFEPPAPRAVPGGNPVTPVFAIPSPDPVPVPEPEDEVLAVTETPSELAFTGVDSTSLASMGLALLGAGAMLAGHSRLRRRDED